VNLASYQSQVTPGRDGFIRVLHAEWTKFRTVRAWTIGIAAAALVLVVFSLLVGQGSHASSCSPSPSGGGEVCTGAPSKPIGPGGEAVTDTYYLRSRTLTGDGTITARVTSLTGVISKGRAAPAGGQQSGPSPGARADLEPWAKTGLIITASTKPGAAYATILVTGDHGVRMQYDYTHDIAGIAGSPTQTAPRWLRLTRSGDTITGFDSTDGTKWIKVGSAHLAGLPTTVPAGMFATSPDHVQTNQHLFGGTSCVSSGPSCSGGPTLATGTFDHVNLQGAWSQAQWTGSAIGFKPGEPTLGNSSQTSAMAFTVSGSGDIAPAVAGAVGGVIAIEHTLIGASAALIVVSVLATVFVTGEYRRRIIRTTITASPHRGRVLAAKAIVIATVTFVAGVIGATVAVVLGKHLLEANGNYVSPAGTGTEIQVIAGTAALLAVAAVAALALGTILRRSAGAVTAVIVAVVLPYILSVSNALPLGAADWLLRLTPAAAFAVQQSTHHYHQVNALYTPGNGFFPLAPAAGLAVLCVYTAVALGAAVFLLHRRDV
jgi:ABC-type transport system involved in multi-copper enzyme maturation permease subunit